MSEDQSASVAEKKRTGYVWLVGAVVVILVGLWLFIRPGIFTVQPIGALPEGVTIMYHSRNPGTPFFSSPDGLCLMTQGTVSLMCRAATLSAMADLVDRMMVRLPYSSWAYLRSTGGRVYEQ